MSLDTYVRHSIGLGQFYIKLNILSPVPSYFRAPDAVVVGTTPTERAHT